MLLPRTTKIENDAKLETNKLTNMQRLIAVSSRAADDALNRFRKASNPLKLLKEENIILKLQFCKMMKRHDIAVTNWDGRLRKATALKARVHIPSNELDLLKRPESSKCVLKSIPRIERTLKVIITYPFTGLPQNTVCSCGSIRRDVYEAESRSVLRKRLSIARRAAFGTMFMTMYALQHNVPGVRL